MRYSTTRTEAPSSRAARNIEVKPGHRGLTLLLLLASTGLPARTAEIAYNVVDLGWLGGNDCGANGINSSGMITGTCETASGELHAYRWDAINGMQDLGNTPDGLGTGAYAINDSGVIVGKTYDLSGSQAWYHDGEYHYIPHPERGSLAFDINNSGAIVGVAVFADTGLRAFKYYNGVIENLGSLGGASAAASINADGVIVGNSEGGGAFRKFDGSPMHSLQFGGIDSAAYAINDAGQVVGIVLDGIGAGQYHAVRWDGSVHNPGTLGGCSQAVDINSSGVIVGHSAISGCSGLRGFVYSEVTGLQDLNGLIAPDSGWTISLAQAIDDNGRIVGRGIINGEAHAIRLDPVNPVPEPGTAFLMAAALGLAGLQGKRRTGRP